MMRIGLTLSVFGLLFLVGCGWWSVDSGGNPIAGSLSQPTGNASVQMKILLPDRPEGTPDAAIVAQEASAISVTFRLLLIDGRNTANPILQLSKTVAVDPAGGANTTFSGIPDCTAVGEILITGGNVGGKTEFHGAADLADGITTILEVTPKGCRHPSDVAAWVLETIGARPDLIAAFPLTGVASALRALVPPSAPETIYQNVLHSFLGSALASVIVTINPSSDLKTVTLSNGITASAGTVWEPAGVGLPSFEVHRVWQPGIGGFGLVSWLTLPDRDVCGLTRLSTTSGQASSSIRFLGTIRFVAPLRDGRVAVGGTRNGHPLLFVWSGLGHITDVPTTAGTDVPFVETFPSLSTDLLKQPSIEYLEADPLTGNLFCAARDAILDLLRLYRVDLSTGLVTPVKEAAAWMGWAKGGAGCILTGWDPITGATGYNLYLASGTTVSTASLKLADVADPYLHVGLASGEVYTYLVAWYDSSGAEKGYSNPFSGTVLSAKADGTPPTVGSLSPASGATDVATNTSLTLVFSEPMTVPTLTTTNILLSSGSTPVLGKVTTSPDGQVATFTPSSPLSHSCVYSLTVATGVLDVAGNPLESVFSSQFTTITPPDLTPPTVLSTVPAAGATRVATNTSITLVFSEPMATSTLNTTTITLASGSTPVLGVLTVSTDGQMATFTPDSPLALLTVFTVTVTTGAQDLAGNALEADFIRSFTTSEFADSTPPTVVSVLPASGAIGIASNTTISLGFSEPIATSTLTTKTFTVVDEGGKTVLGAVTSSDDGTLATFTPTTALAESTRYSVSVTTSVTDVVGNPLAAKFSWSFTTTDTIAPTVVSVLPQSGATLVGTGSAITVQFSEPMQVSTLSTSTITLASGSIGIEGRVEVSSDGTVATFTPREPLSFAAVYTASVDSGVRDLGGNPLAASYVWSFQTPISSETVPPTVFSVIPASGAIDVPTNSLITLTFSEPMATSTLNTSNITLASGTTDVSWTSVTVSQDGMVATCTPSRLRTGRVYTVNVGTGVTDVVGNALVEPFISTFKVK